jgi:predicted nucleic acid-binding protein
MGKDKPGVVVDCSLTVSWFFGDEKNEFADRILTNAAEIEIWVPAIWILEFANVLLVARKRKRITEEEHRAILNHAERLPIRVDNTATPINKVTGLAIQYGLTSYDAAYLECAIRRNLTLATLDKDLKSAANKAGVNSHG